MAQEDDFDADFSAGFSDDAPTKSTPTPTEGAQDETGEAVVTEGETEADGAAVAEPAAEPVYAKITQADYDKLLAAANEVGTVKAEHKRLLDSAFGKIGGMQELFNQLKAATAPGAAVTVSEDDFADLAEEYPELAKLQVKGMNALLSKMKPTGTPVAQAPVAATPAIDPEQVIQQAEQRVEQKLELKRFARKHPDWQDVVNGQEFKDWITKQPADVLKGYQESWDSDVTIPILDSFKASRKAPASPAASTRQQRLSSAVPPRGTGGHAPKPTEDDDFLAGFNSE